MTGRPGDLETGGPDLRAQQQAIPYVRLNLIAFPILAREEMIMNLNLGVLLAQIVNGLVILSIPIAIILAAILIQRRFRNLEHRINELEKSIKDQ